MKSYPGLVPMTVDCTLSVFCFALLVQRERCQSSNISRTHTSPRCGQDGRGYKTILPRGWGSKIGIALRIGVLVVAAASDAGHMAELPVPSQAGSGTGGDGRDEHCLSPVEWQGQVVDAVYDGLAGAVDAKANDMIDSAFMNVDSEVRIELSRPAALTTTLLFHTNFSR